jgi:putative addiction module component (TIGR02574 family)
LSQTRRMGDPAFDITGLTPHERLELIERLWDSLTPEDVPLTEAQQKELQRRLERLERDGVSGRSWDEVEHRVRGGGQR